MSGFFSDTVGIEFVSLGFLHIIVICIVILGVFLIYFYREKIRNLKFERKLAMGLAIFALIWEFAHYFWQIGNGIWTMEDSLPIGLCAFTLYVAIFAMYFKKFSLFEIGYFWTWGAIASILFPDILYSVDRFRFYQYMIGHSFFFFLFAYMIFVYKWYPTFKSFIRSCITLTLIVIILLITSHATGSNLMYMLNADETPFSMFEGNGYLFYITGVILMSLAIMFIWYIPFYFYNKRNQKKIEKK